MYVYLCVPIHLCVHSLLYVGVCMDFAESEVSVEEGGQVDLRIDQTGQAAVADEIVFNTQDGSAQGVCV